MKRVLVLTTADQNGKLNLPGWALELGRVDLFVINPSLGPPELPVSSALREVFVYSGETGLKDEGSLHLFLRAYNEGLRRRFRDILHWGRWDALMVDGIRSVLPLVGDRGIEVPRELSWIVYRLHPSDHETEAEQRVSRLSVWRLRRWHKALLLKAAEVVVDEKPKLLHRYFSSG